MSKRIQVYEAEIWQMAPGEGDARLLDEIDGPVTRTAVTFATSMGAALHRFEKEYGADRVVLLRSCVDKEAL